PNNQHEDHFPKPQQNFSFSSSYPYAPGRTTNANSNTNSSNYYNVQRYQSPYNFQHVVTNAFSVLQPQAAEELALNPRPQQAIVRPTRRQEVPLEPEPSVDHVDPPRSFFSRSNQEVRSFADELSHKLRFLAPEENYGGGSPIGTTGAWMAARNSGEMSQRPRFETTVPTGIFLPPPHEVQMLPASMLRRHVYAYSSYPMILQSYYSKDPLKSPNPGEKEIKAVSATRLNGYRATAAVAAATAAVAAAPASVSAAPKAPSSDPSQSLAGGLHITKAQFQQQLQQRRGTSDK
ncbi:Hypothetical predicted protein, partial [Drosophila guanche]